MLSQKPCVSLSVRSLHCWENRLAPEEVARAEMPEVHMPRKDSFGMKRMMA